MKLFFSIFSGLVYQVFDDEEKNLDEGQVPLKSKPSASCKHCFGRGFDHIDREKGIYPMCRCMRKHIRDGYKPVQVRLLPKDN